MVEVVDLQSFNPVENVSADGVTGITKRRRFRFRNAKVSSAPNVSKTAGKKHVPVERHRLQHTKTM